MFSQAPKRRALVSSLVKVLTLPQSIDRYTELVAPTWSLGEARAKIVTMRRSTPRCVTSTLQPNTAFPGSRAGHHLNVTLDVNGRRHTRCYSPANTEGRWMIEQTVGLHDVRVLHGFARSAEPGDLRGHFGVDHLPDAMPAPEVVYVCGPPSPVAAVREHCPAAISEAFVAPVSAPPAAPSGGRITFRGSNVSVVDDGRPLLEQPNPRACSRPVAAGWAYVRRSPAVNPLARCKT